MDDNTIVQMYWDRNEKAISATSEKYGSYCLSIARNITSYWITFIGHLFTLLFRKMCINPALNQEKCVYWQHIGSEICVKIPYKFQKNVLN
jgi:hypothetical protein